MTKPTARELLDEIGTWGLPEDEWSGDAPCDRILAARVEAVLVLHAEHRIYDECGQHHAEGDDDAVDCGDYTSCETAYQYSVCHHTTDGEPREDTEDGEWPCPTVRLLNGKKP